MLFPMDANRLPVLLWLPLLLWPSSDSSETRLSVTGPVPKRRAADFWLCVTPSSTSLASIGSLWAFWPLGRGEAMILSWSCCLLDEGPASMVADFRGSAWNVESASVWTVMLTLLPGFGIAPFFRIAGWVCLPCNTTGSCKFLAHPFNCFVGRREKHPRGLILICKNIKNL